MKVRIWDLTRARDVCSKLLVILLVLSLVFLSFYIGSSAGEELYIETASVKEAPLVILDPGHGGEDPGTVGVSGVLEKNLNLEIALTLGELLRENGYAVMYTRTEDALLYRPEENVKGMRKIYDLKNRAAYAEAHPDSIFISLHMNAFGDSRYSGLQVYYNVNDKSSETLAKAVQEEVVLQLQPDNRRKIKSGKDIYLMENIATPSILVECGFLTNREECEKLSQKEYQKRLCFAILCGIIKYDSTRK